MSEFMNKQSIPRYTPDEFNSYKWNRSTDLPDIFIITDPEINIDNVHLIEDEQIVPDNVQCRINNNTKVAISNFIFEKYNKRSMQQKEYDDIHYNGRCYYYFSSENDKRMIKQLQQFLSFNTHIKLSPYFITYWGCTDSNVLGFHKDVSKMCDSRKYSMVSCVYGVRRFYVIPEKDCKVKMDDKKQIHTVTYNGLSLPLYNDGSESTFKLFLYKNHDKIPYVDIKAGEHIFFRKTVYHATCNPTDFIEEVNSIHIENNPTGINVCSFVVDFTF